MERDKISVIIPAYNASATIERCLNSILGGHYRNIEVIVINDASTDDTENIVRRYQEKDNRVVLINNEENHGCGYGKSFGARNSTGRFITFCDADDWYDNNYLSEHHKHISEYEADISQCRMQPTNLKDVGNSDKVDIIEDGLVKKYIQYQSVTVSICDKLFRRELVIGDDFLNELRYADDLYMNYIASRLCSRIVRFNSTKYNWYCNSASLSRGKFNPARLECDFTAWNMIIFDCEKCYPELVETARLSSELWIAGTYRSMVNSHYHNKELEKKIARYIRQDGIIKTLAAEKNRANKRFIRLAMISMPLARYTWYVLTGAKRMVKKEILR